MATGDEAAAAGLSVVPATADARNGYEAINERGDELARHFRDGHPATAITGTWPLARTSGVLSPEHGGTGTGAVFDNTTPSAGTGSPRLVAVANDDVLRAVTGALHPSYIPGVVNATPDSIVQRDGSGRITSQDPTAAAHVATKGYVDGHAGGGAAERVTSTAYGREAGASRYAMWMDGALNIGRAVSSQRYKDHITAHDVDVDAVLALTPVTYHYKSDPPDEREFGLIAEDVHAAGLPEIVTWFDGQIDGLRYDLLAVALLAVVKEQAATLVSLRKDVDDLLAAQSNNEEGEHDAARQ